MNIRLFVPSLALSGLLLSMGAYAQDPDHVVGNGDPVNKDPADVRGSVPQIDLSVDYELVARLPKVPVSLPTFEVVRSDPTAIDPRRETLASAFDFEPEKRGEDKSNNGALSVMFTDKGGRSIEYFSSGAVFYMKEELFSEYADDLLASQKLGRDAATKRYAEQAEGFLRKTGLARKGMFLRNVSFTEVKSMDYKGQRESVRTVGAAAHFGYRLEGIPAWGAGAKTSVYFDADGITGVYDALPDLVPGKAVQLRPPEAAMAAYMARKIPASLYRLYTGAVDRVVIQQVQLVYQIEAGNSNQRVVAPYYLIQGTFHGKDVSSTKGSETKSEFIWLEPAAA